MLALFVALALGIAIWKWVVPSETLPRLPRPLFSGEVAEGHDVAAYRHRRARSPCFTGLTTTEHVMVVRTLIEQSGNPPAATA